MDHRKLTVLILATTFPRWEGDTVPQFIFELSKGLRDEDINPVVLAPHYPGADRREIMAGVTVYRFPYFVPFRLQRLALQGQGGIIPAMKQSHLAKLQVPFFFLSLLAHTIWIIFREDIDIVNSHWLVPNGGVGSLVTSLMSKPHVLTLHARGVLFIDRIPLKSKFVKFVYSNSDMILPVSTHIRDVFIQATNEDLDPDDRFRIQPMGAHTSEFDLQQWPELKSERSIEDGTRALFVGRLADKKGLRYLIDAVELLVGRDRSLHNFELTIVGTGPLEDDLQDYVKTRNLDDYISFTGWVSEDELNKQYVAADFVIVPSIETESGDTEGMPTVISEAFASENPVIGTDVGGIGDVVRNGVNGFVIEQKNADALATSIERLIDNPQLHERLAQGALDSADELDWSRCAAVYANTFKMVYRNQNDNISSGSSLVE